MALESEKVLHEFTYSDLDNKRKKIDGLTLFCNEGAKDMVDAKLNKRDLESLKSEHKFDSRKSLAWDNAFSTCPGFLEQEELFNTLNSRNSQSGCGILGHEVHQLLSAKYLEPEIKSVTDEINLRKSLAWDSAFSTCEGVLNSEELSLVNKGYKKSGIHMLPRIEELWMSFESNCTIDSDGSSLTSLEVELFANTSASMEHLSKASSTFAPRSRKEKYTNMQKLNSTKKVDGDGVPKLKAKFRPTSSRQTINGKCLTVNPNQGKSCRDNPSSSPSSEISSSSPWSSSNESKVSQPPSRQLSTTRSCLKFSSNKNDTPNVNTTACISTLTNQTTSENCGHPAYSSVKMKYPACILFSASTDSSSHTTSANESSTKSCTDNDSTAHSDIKVLPRCQSNVSDDKGSMCKNPSTELKGIKYVSSDDPSRNIKPSGLRMPSPKIGFFDVDDSLVLIENGSGKSHSSVQIAASKVGTCSTNLNMYANRSRAGKIQIPQTMKDIKTTKIFPKKTRRSLISRTTKSAPPVSKAQSELHCVMKTKDYYLRNNPHMLHENEKENLIGFENRLECLHQQVRTLGVSGDVVI
ncbi:hypothetical protein RIF29_18445 [Crotalaria pallida]|uniref:Uncharacterized protein n=1 Tax=Crotalaria pallida TaxID=3830 RepID=A0AAN9FKG1_CROPI